MIIIILLSCKGGIGDKNSVAKIMAKKCQCVVYASSFHMDYLIDMIKRKKCIILVQFHTTK